MSIFSRNGLIIKYYINYYLRISLRIYDHFRLSHLSVLLLEGNYGVLLVNINLDIHLNYFIKIIKLILNYLMILFNYQLQVIFVKILKLI